ncbi:PEGA domain-containing protein [Persicimonas caeni]|uniref:PEGA domain-containing protein n=1 Tax=Persicimonas caeni TaxID=2292766 RepID=A0A4Y6Q2X3_PERCE|nr:PEGA domain-containing protein [Persicimonas caeni]QDG54527.1 PEGA domain-containing protein [Persicimonas caeni]QED35748.1 PEGA domain-containing protein [Persicimonas caeni]
MIHRFFAVAVLILLTLLALPAFAQDGKQGDSSGASVVILKFETFNADQAVMDDFYMALHEAIDGHPEMHVKPGGDVSINDLILTLGCESANAECLAGLSDFVEGDRIVYGSVERSENVYLFSLKMFDFARGEFVREVSDKTIEGNTEQIKQGVRAVIEGFLYGDVGKLEVAVNGASDAEVFFDGEKVGQGPTTLSKLPLGEHAVTVRTADGQKKSKKVMLHRGKVSKVIFDFEGAKAVEAPGAVASNNYAVPGWTAVGLGTVGLVAGVLGTTQVSSYDSEAESMICGDALCPAASTERANKLQDDMDSAYTMSIIGYSVAAVGFAAGGYLLYETYAGGAESEQPSTDETDIEPTVNVGADSASVGVRIGF